MTTNRTIDGVPRELLLRFYNHVYIRPALRDSDHHELRALLDAPAVEPRGEPVAWVEVSGDGSFWPDSYTTEDMSGRAGFIPLYRHHAEQSAPVAVVMPERMQHPGRGHDYAAQGWNSCLDEVTRLNTK